jgi:hypothetical protein
MNSLVAMRRANGDWFALDDEGRFRVPVFHSAGDAMLARARDSGMECFRPVVLDEVAFKNLTTTDEGKACFWLVEDPLRRLSLGRPLDHTQLARLMQNGDEQAGSSRVRK